MSLRTRTSALVQRAWLAVQPSPLPSPAPLRPFSSSSCTCSPTSSSSATTTTTTERAPGVVHRADLRHPSLAYLQSLAGKDLSAFDPVLDLDPSKQRQLPAASPRTHDQPARVTLINDTPNNAGYQQPRPSPDQLDGLPGEDDSVAHLAQLSHMTAGEIRSLYRFPLVVKRVVTMKSKGKMPSMYALVVVGNGRGLVGTGEGKDDTAQKAVQKAFNQAVRSMDYVERYEDRTVSGTMRSNFGSCKVEMRSRPPGPSLSLSLPFSPDWRLTLSLPPCRLWPPRQPLHPPGRKGRRHLGPVGKGLRLAQPDSRHQARRLDAPRRLKPSRCVPLCPLSFVVSSERN